jgi:glutamate/aspartate transport system substrate-binding protein
MKQTVQLLALLFMALLAQKGTAQESASIQKLRETGIITIGFREGSIPFSYLNQRKEPIGYSIDICTRIVDDLRQRLNLPELEVQYRLVSSANRLSMVENGLVDMECGTTTNNIERQKRVAFSKTIYLASSSFLYKKSFPLNDLRDLRNKTVVTTAGTTYVDNLKKLNKDYDLNLNVIVGKDHVESYLMVESQWAAAFAMDDAILFGLAANAQHPSEYGILPIAMSVEPYGVGLRKHDPEFKKLVDQAIDQLFASGEVYGIYKKWFQQPIPPKQVNLNLPITPLFRRLVSKPTDSANPADYR